jgi:Holliday junction resolvase
MVDSRNKGAAYERELAKEFRFYGYETRRGQQYCGANGDADVIGLPHIHIEAKRVEKLNLTNAMTVANIATWYQQSKCGRAYYEKLIRRT